MMYDYKQNPTGLPVGVVRDSRTIDERIAIYEEENQEIDNYVFNVVKNYANYESKTFEKLKTEDANTLVSFYPELQTKDLIMEQLTIYNSNKRKILYLKEKKLDYSISKWWVYFGK